MFPTPASSSQRSKLALLLIACAALLWPGVAAAGGGHHPRLSVATYNIHHGVGIDGELDLAEIAEVLSATGADVIGLQEVDNGWSARSDFEDQAARLAEMLGMEYAYGANLDLESSEPGAPRRQYGTAILSSYPLLDWHNTLLPNLGGEQRGLLDATVLVWGQRVRVLNTHLQHNSAEERAAQTRAIAEYLDALEEPAILLGDLNAQPTDSELHVLRLRLDDAWSLGGEGPGYTFPVETPNRRIDYVLVGRCLAVRSAQVASTPASDHLPLSAVVRLPSWKARGRCQAAPLARAHAHNDYEHERPLLDALDNGFASVEADLWLVDGELLVAHDAEDLDPARTFEALYLEPLRRRVWQNRGGVFPRWPHSVQLLIDIKTEGEPTYLAIDEQLRQYRDLFTRFARGKVQEKAITAVISGNRPRELMASQRVRYAGYDGRMSDLGDGSPASFIPLISDRWTSHFEWTGEGAMPQLEREKLHEIVQTAHDNGQRVRFWATPEDPLLREAVWAELVAAGVDYINTDHLSELRAYLLLEDARPSEPELDWFAPRRSRGRACGERW